MDGTYHQETASVLCRTENSTAVIGENSSPTATIDVHISLDGIHFSDPLTFFYYGNSI